MFRFHQEPMQKVTNKKGQVTIKHHNDKASITLVKPDKTTIKATLTNIPLETLKKKRYFNKANELAETELLNSAVWKTRLAKHQLIKYCDKAPNALVFVCDNDTDVASHFNFLIEYTDGNSGVLDIEFPESRYFLDKYIHALLEKRNKK